MSVLCISGFLWPGRESQYGIVQRYLGRFKPSEATPYQFNRSRQISISLSLPLSRKSWDTNPTIPKGILQNLVLTYHNWAPAHEPTFKCFLYLPWSSPDCPSLLSPIPLLRQGVTLWRPGWPGTYKTSSRLCFERAWIKGVCCRCLASTFFSESLFQFLLKESQIESVIT